MKKDLIALTSRSQGVAQQVCQHARSERWPTAGWCESYGLNGVDVPVQKLYGLTPMEPEMWGLRTAATHNTRNADAVLVFCREVQSDPARTVQLSRRGMFGQVAWCVAYEESKPRYEVKIGSVGSDLRPMVSELIAVAHRVQHTHILFHMVGPLREYDQQAAAATIRELFIELALAGFQRPAPTFHAKARRSSESEATKENPPKAVRPIYPGKPKRTPKERSEDIAPPQTTPRPSFQGKPRQTAPKPSGSFMMKRLTQRHPGKAKP